MLTRVSFIGEAEGVCGLDPGEGCGEQAVIMEKEVS